MIVSPVQLRFHDMDILGHMYNGQYFHIFDIGKLEFLDKVVGIRWGDSVGVVNVSAAITYIEQVKLGDRIEIHTLAEKIGTKSFTILHRMVEKNTGTVKAESRVTLVAFDFARQKSINILPQWRERIVKDIAE